MMVRASASASSFSPLAWCSSAISTAPRWWSIMSSRNRRSSSGPDSEDSSAITASWSMPSMSMPVWPMAFKSASSGGSSPQASSQPVISSISGPWAAAIRSPSARTSGVVAWAAASSAISIAPSWWMVIIWANSVSASLCAVGSAVVVSSAAGVSSAVLAVLTLAAGLTACSTEPEPASTADDTPAAEETTTADPTAHNDADTEFAQMMTIHHEGAIEMAELAAAQATTPEVRALGERIVAAQGPEIELMTGWLEAWGEDPPDEAELNAMGHTGMDMEGMDQEAVMAELSSLSGPELDRRFLELMIDHHRGAVEMAEEHHASGLNDDALALARTIIDDQQVEITEMNGLLQNL